MSIQSFADEQTEKLFRSGKTRAGWQSAKAIAARKLDHLDAAIRIADLRAPPGNRLEQLSGRSRDFWSIRINDQWRVIFRWSEAGPEDVAIVDYH